MKCARALVPARFRTVCFLAALLATGMQAAAQAPVATMPPDATRGQLLYSTHCIACHSAKMHWREKKLAVDRESLQRQVRRWMVLSGLNWGNEEANAVAQYLNDTYYHYPEPPAPRKP